jgi:hypothetical protein
LVTEDVLLLTETSSNAEDMVDQDKVIDPLMLMSNAQELHGSLNMSRLDHSLDIPVKAGLKSNTEVSGDQSPLTTSGITTMVQELSVKTSDMAKV